MEINVLILTRESMESCRLNRTNAAAFRLISLMLGECLKELAILVYVGIRHYVFQCFSQKGYEQQFYLISQIQNFAIS